MMLKVLFSKCGNNGMLLGRCVHRCAKPIAALSNNILKKQEHSLSSKHYFSENVTYSGGQATQGQGGFYGSGGARCSSNNNNDNLSAAKQVVALAADVQHVQQTMDQLEELEHQLSLQSSKNDKEENQKMTVEWMELKQRCKKLVTSSTFLESLNRLEYQGQPTWGLSEQERIMISEARIKVQET